MRLKKERRTALACLTPFVCVIGSDLSIRHITGKPRFALQVGLKRDLFLQLYSPLASVVVVCVRALWLVGVHHLRPPKL